MGPPTRTRRLLLWAACGALLHLRGALADAPQDPQPCVSNCTREALEADPTKGCPAGHIWRPHPPAGLPPAGGPTSLHSQFPAAHLPNGSLPGACQPCDPGFFCPAIPWGEWPSHPVNANRRIACPIGTFNGLPGMSQAEDCLVCEKGTWQDWIGSTYCPGCPAGKYINATGSTSKYDCIDCPCGHYCPRGSPEPTPCPAGTYTSNMKMQELPACLACPKGSACMVATCFPKECILCPSGKFGNATGIEAAGRDGGIYGSECQLEDDYCAACPPSFFCPIGSVVPTSCPAGTYSQQGTKEEEDCLDCPVGFECQLPLNASTLQSIMHRGQQGEPVVGSAEPVACYVDEVIRHYSYPEETGCVENCPLRVERQSTCHLNGDGRIAAPDRLALKLQNLIALRSKKGLSSAATQAVALANISTLLTGISDEERVQLVDFPDLNGRTPLILAAMLDDRPLAEMLVAHGAGAEWGLSAGRDVGGLTALMHALRLGHTGVADVLVAAGATLAPADTLTVQNLGVSASAVAASGAPAAALEAPGGHFGRGGLPWTGSGHTPDMSNRSEAG